MDYSKMSVKNFLEGDVDLDRFYSELRNKLNSIESLELVRRKEDVKIEKSGRLKGLPFFLKDSICSKGDLTQAGSKILKGYKPPFDATVSKRLKEAGGVLMGKTHQDEFAFGTGSIYCALATPKNPWDEERCCGGSSGGAAGLAAALDQPMINLGESTGGSISEPAAFCGVVGLTPTYGVVSRYGLISYGNSLDKIGPIARRVEDVAIGLEIISGKDRMDQTTVESNGNYSETREGDISGKTIGLPKQYFEAAESGVRKRVEEATKEMEEMGAELKEVDLPTTEAALPAYYVIAPAEASTNLAKYCGMRYGMHEKLEGNFNEYFARVRSEGFGPEVKRRVMLGTYTRMAGYRDKYYVKALKVRQKIIDDFKRVFKDVDILAGPTAPMVAPEIDELEEMSPVEQYKLDKLTAPINLAGMPQISLPCGFSNEMPVGLHLMGDHFQEKKILRTARAYEKKRGEIDYPEV
ncbi:MAG: amidase family protein [Candidatus Aenigmatarchaeota archaeon]